MIKNSQVLYTVLLTTLILPARGRVTMKDALPSHEENSQVNTIEVETCNGLSTNRPAIGCSQFEKAGKYSLKIGAEQFEADKKVYVNVSKTKCPTSDSPSTKWYQLELFWKNDSNSSNQTYNGLSQPVDVGKLAPRFHRTDVYKCNQKILFYPCEARLYDFPGKFVWTAPKLNSLLIGSICFRLTASEGDSTTCEIVEKCIHMASTTSGSGEGSTYSYDDEEEEEEEEEDVDFNTVNIEKSRSHSTKPEDSIPPKCNEDKDFFEQFNTGWIPHCGCDGYHHPVQCIEHGPATMTCWCSTKHGAEVYETMTTVECDDSKNYTEFELSCLTG